MTHTDSLVRAFILKIATKAIEGKAWLRVRFEKWVIRTRRPLVIGKEKGEVRGEKAFIMFPRSTIRTWRQRDLECEFTHSIYVSGTQGIWL